jgi:hypothetical protein
MRSTLALSLLATAAPLAVHAQTPQERQRDFEVEQRFEQQRLDRQTAEIQRQMDTAVRNLTPPPPQVIPYTPPPVIVIQSADARTRELAAQLAAANARLKALEDAEKKRAATEKAENKPKAETP